MKKTTLLVTILCLLLVVLAGCDGNSNTPSVEVDNIQTNSIATDFIYETEMRWAAVPAVFVNDTWFRIFEDHQRIVPHLDDTWVYLGVIQSAVPGWESPVMNFQTNDERMIGAEIFHSSNAHIPVTNDAWGDPMNGEIIGEGIVVIFGDLRILYVAEETSAKILDLMNKVERHSLMIDGIIYSLMATVGGGVFSITEDHIFLGEVASDVSNNELPIENLQVNRNSTVGARVYRLPQGENSDIVVFFNSNNRLYFSNLPGVNNRN